MKTIQVHSGYAQTHCSHLNCDVQLVGDVSREYSAGQLQNETTVWTQCSGEKECRQNPINCGCSSLTADPFAHESLR